jgi:hypothetical protein
MSRRIFNQAIDPEHRVKINHLTGQVPLAHFFRHLRRVDRRARLLRSMPKSLNKAELSKHVKQHLSA